MATYNFKGEGYAVPYEAPGMVTIKRTVNIPALIANQNRGQELVDDDGNVLTLPSTGFATSDVLRVFKVPANFVVVGAGVNVATAEGAVATADLGDGDEAAGYLDDADLNATGITLMAVGAAYGPDNVTGKAYAANDSIDMLFNNDDVDTAVFDVFIMGYWA